MITTGSGTPSIHSRHPRPIAHLLNRRTETGAGGTGSGGR